jgi:prophage regulatory protein
MAPNLVRLPAVKAKTGKSRTSIYSAVAAGTFPKPVKIDGKSVAWVDTEVDDWVARRIAEHRIKHPVAA